MLALNSFNFILVRLSPNINVSLAHIQARLFKKDVNANEDDFVFNNKIKEDKSINNYNTSDEPINLTFNPYNKEPKKCILCKHQIKLDYKNSRLLQQFVSSFSGRVYDRHVTGLCDKQHDILLKTIAMSRKAGYMPIFTKNPKFLRDPKLFDPLRPVRQHSFA